MHIGVAEFATELATREQFIRSLGRQLVRRLQATVPGDQLKPARLVLWNDCEHVAVGVRLHGLSGEIVANQQRREPGPSQPALLELAKRVLDQRRVPLTARLLLRESLTARRAAAIIAAVTLVITLAGGILERVFDRQEFPTIGKGLWLALQTVTIGYGDLTPKHSDGRFIAAVVMLTGVGFLAVITASVTASLVESSRRRFAESEVDLARRLEEVTERLIRIEAALARGTRPVSSDGLS